MQPEGYFLGHLDTGISFKDPELPWWLSFVMNQQQTYKESSFFFFFFVEWMGALGGALVYDK